MANELTRYITLDSIAKDYLLRAGKQTNSEYANVFRNLMLGYQELEMDVIKKLKYTYLPVDPATKSVALPKDFVQYTRIGFENQSREIVDLTYDPNLAFAIESPACTCPDCGQDTEVCNKVCTALTSESSDVVLNEYSKACNYNALFQVLGETTLCGVSAAYPLTINTIAINAGSAIAVNRIANSATQLLAIIFVYTNNLELDYTLNWTDTNGTHTCTWTRSYAASFPFTIQSYTKDDAITVVDQTIADAGALTAYMTSIGWSLFTTSNYNIANQTSVWDKFTITRSTPYLNGLNEVTYNLTHAVLPANCTMFIDGNTYALGVIDTTSDLVAVLNNLNLGTFSYDSVTKMLTIIGSHNYITPNGLLVGATPFTAFSAQGITDIDIYPSSCTVTATPVTKTNTLVSCVNVNGDVTTQTCAWLNLTITSNCNYYIDLSDFEAATYPITDGQLIKNGSGINLPTLNSLGELVGYLESIGFLSSDPLVPSLYISGSTDTYTSVSSLSQFIQANFTSDSCQTVGALEQKCFTQTICEITILPCGCPQLNNKIINTLVQANLVNNAMFERGVHGTDISLTYRQPANLYGFYNVSPYQGIIQLDPYFKYDTVYFEYYSFDTIDSKNFLVPTLAREYLIAYVHKMMNLYKNNVSRGEKEAIKKECRAAKHNLRLRWMPPRARELKDLFDTTSQA